MSALKRFLEFTQALKISHVKRQTMNCIAPDGSDIGELQELARWTKYGRPLERKEDDAVSAGTVSWDVSPD